MTAASVGQKIIAFVYFAMIARTIGAEGTGKYFFALAFTTVFVIFVDLGFTNVLVREAAKARDKMQQYFSTVLSIKILFGILTYIAAVIAINLLGYPVETKHLVYLSAVTMLFDSLHLTIYGVLRSIGDLKWEAMGIVGSQGLTLILGSFFLFTGQPLIFLILAFTIPSALNALYAALVAWKKYALSLAPRFDKQTFYYLGRIAIPFAIAAIFARVYSYADTLILSKLAGDQAVGWYSIPYKITFAFQFIPLALVAALYPRFSEFFVKDKQRLAEVFHLGMKYLLVIAFPVAVGIAVLAHDIVFLLFTAEYLPSVLPLQILIMSLIFSFVSFPIGAFLNACNKQVAQTWIVGIVMVANIILNLILIPIYGVSGAAAAALVGNALLAVLGYMIVPQITKVNHWKMAKLILQLVISAAVMGFSVWYSLHYVATYTTIPIGGIVYVAMLFVTGAVKKDQLHEIRHVFKR